MRVPHGGGYRLVPEKFLNGSNIHTLHHPLAGPEVAQVVKTHPSQTCLLRTIERSLEAMPRCAILQADEDREASIQT
jgi:hypothetical protein